MYKKMTRRDCIWRLIKSVSFFLFFFGTGTRVDSSSVCLAQSNLSYFLIIDPKDRRHHPEKFRRGSKICGSEKSLRILRENFDMRSGITYREMSFPQLHEAMQKGVCDAAFLIGSGRYSAREMQERFFRYWYVYEVKP